MSDQTGSERPESGSDPGSGAQPENYPGQAPYPGATPYPGGPAPYPGQPPYPGQAPAPGYPGQPPYPGQAPAPGYPGQPPPYPGQQQMYGNPPQSTYASPDPGAYLGAPSYPGYGTAQNPNAARKFSGWAIAAFITGLVPLIGILAALPLGIVALVKISRTGDRGKWLAIIGMVVAGLWWVGAVALGLWVQSNQAHRDDAGVITEAGTLDFGEVRTGDCVTIPGILSGGTVGAFDIEGVPCADAHNAQALFVVTFPDTDYPGKVAIGQKTAQVCGPKYAAEDVPGADQYLLYPTESRWDQSDGHRAICFITAGGQTMTGSSLN